jgi:hypothetical protein
MRLTLHFHDHIPRKRHNELLVRSTLLCRKDSSLLYIRSRIDIEFRGLSRLLPGRWLSLGANTIALLSVLVVSLLLCLLPHPVHLHPIDLLPEPIWLLDHPVHLRSMHPIHLHPSSTGSLRLRLGHFVRR